MRAARSGQDGASGRARLWRSALIALALTLVSAPVAVASSSLPDEAPGLLDQAGLLSPPVRARLARQLAEREAMTGSAIVVVTVESLGRRELEDRARELREHWQLDRRAMPGALLLVAWQERGVWLGATGPRPGPEVEDLETVVDAVILPAFHRGAFDRGLQAGVAALAELLAPVVAGAARATAPRSPVRAPWWLMAPRPEVAARLPLAAALLMVAAGAILLTRLAELPPAGARRGYAGAWGPAAPRRG